MSAPLLALVPALIASAAPKGTRGLSLYPGRVGVALGAALIAGSAAVGAVVWEAFGAWWAFLPIWLLGTAGAAMIASGVRPVAFVKPLCTRCRLLPVIVEHESIHLAGVSSEEKVWAEMRRQHAPGSLALDDSAICPFCPIPKRMAAS